MHLQKEGRSRLRHRARNPRMTLSKNLHPLVMVHKRETFSFYLPRPVDVRLLVLVSSLDVDAMWRTCGHGYAVPTYIKLPDGSEFILCEEADRDTIALTTLWSDPHCHADSIFDKYGPSSAYGRLGGLEVFTLRDSVRLGYLE